MSVLEAYLRNAGALLAQAAQTQAPAMEAAAQAIYVGLRDGGMLYTFGTGHAHLLAEEVFYRAGGLVRVCPVLDERLMLHASASESTAWERREGIAAEVLARYPARPGDVMLVASNSGRNAAPVEMALAARAMGMPVIALTNLRHSQGATPRNAHGKRLFEVADIVLDNLGEVGDAAMPTASGGRVGPTSTVVGAAMLQAIVCRVEALAAEADTPVAFFVSSNIDGGDAVNAALIEANRGLIKHL